MPSHIRTVIDIKEGIMHRSSRSRVTTGFVLILAVIALAAGSASAQRYGRNWDGYPNWGGGFDLRQTALNAGYNEGNREGTRDRARGRFTSNFNDFSSYRNANKDYSSRMGDRTLYQRYFRLAFENGYADGTGTSAATGGGYGNNDNDWDRDRDRDRDRGRDRNRDRDRWRNRNGRGNSGDGYPNWGGSSDLRQTALNAGFGDGHKAGQEDMNRRRGDDYSRHSEYREATRDYSSRLGDRELYKRYYRIAFEHGYADGISGN
jgi:hypothetical protein